MTTVDDLASDPVAHLGEVAVVGVVAAVKAGQGFVIVDKREYAACGLSCFNEPWYSKSPGALGRRSSEIPADGSHSRSSRKIGSWAGFFCQECN